MNMVGESLLQRPTGHGPSLRIRGISQGPQLPTRGSQIAKTSSLCGQLKTTHLGSTPPSFPKRVMDVLCDDPPPHPTPPLRKYFQIEDDTLKAQYPEKEQLDPRASIRFPLQHGLFAKNGLGKRPGPQVGFSHVS